MAIQLDNKATVQIIVNKNTDNVYTLRATLPVWNSLQVALIKGFEADGINVELIYKLPEVTQQSLDKVDDLVEDNK